MSLDRSHTWGADEPTYAEWQRREGQDTRAGYRKIEEASRQALNDGWKYLWVDTVCIDKSSSSELSEAINSMFAWYKASCVCYVYLSDVYVHPRMHASGEEVDAVSASILKQIKASRWITRGWTLQELIAPGFLTFFSREWIPIGKFRKYSPSRESRPQVSTAFDHTAPRIDDFVEHIAAITNIPRKYLMREELYLKASIARRMSWASLRQTTRIEDMAYCLLGIFDINMPLLYGEGSRAFIRLQEEIMKISTDQSIFAWNCIDVLVPRRQGDISIMAPSPSAFKGAENVIHCDPSTESIADTMFTLSNFGLSLQLPLFRLPHTDKEYLWEEYVLCMLNCRLETQEPDKRLYLPLRRTVNVGNDALYERCYRPSAPLSIFPSFGENKVPPSERIYVPRIRESDRNSLWNINKRCWRMHHAHDWTVLVLFEPSTEEEYSIKQWSLFDVGFQKCNSWQCENQISRQWLREDNSDHEYFSLMLEVEQKVKGAQAAVNKAVVRLDVRRTSSSAELGKSVVCGPVTILSTGGWSDTWRLKDMWKPSLPSLSSYTVSTFPRAWAVTVEPELKLDAGDIVIPLCIGLVGAYSVQPARRYEEVWKLLKSGSRRVGDHIWSRASRH